MTKRIAWVTCEVLPEPDPDQDPTLAALRRAGLDADLLAWDDPAGDPSAFDLCVLRSCWNYYEDPQAFLAWIERAASESHLVNPAPVVRWNLHKRYLRALQAADVPVVPTAWFERGGPADLATTMRERGWDDVVVKPAVSAASFLTRRFGPDGIEDGERFLARLVAERDAMVQRYMPSVEHPGERALVWIDGEFTHSVRKSPRFAGGDEQVSEALPLSRRQREIGARALRHVDGAADLLYARVDVVEDDDGALVVSELELMEPSLFLLQSPPAAERFVQAVHRLSRGR